MTMNLDQLLDGAFDQVLADKPEYKPFPAGVHAVQVFFKIKKFGDKGVDGEGYEVKFKYGEQMELTDTSAVPAKAGDEASLSLNMTAKDDFQRENAQGTMKMIVKAAAEKFGGTTAREVIAAADGQFAAITTGTRLNKEKTASFLTLSKVQFL